MKAINKDNIRQVFEALKEHGLLYAPVRADDGSVNFQKIEQTENISLDYANSVEPVKKLFFPQAETLFSYDKDGRQSIPGSGTERKRFIFGMRPCDVKSLLILDRVFDTPEFKDPYYVSKRENTTIFAMGCNNPARNCFCTSLDCGPFAKEGCDVFVTDMGQRYIFEAVTAKGEEVLKQLPQLSQADTKDAEQIEKLSEAAKNKIIKQLNSEGLNKKLAEVFDSDGWDEIHQKCMGCGICTYMCPTCHCFDIVDEATKTDGRRVRIWDSCMSENFTREASGHNPRRGGKDRMRQRIMHKFSWFVDNNGQYACVGCGRCIKNCPAGMNIIKAIEQILKASDE